MWILVFAQYVFYFLIIIIYILRQTDGSAAILVAVIGARALKTAQHRTAAVIVHAAFEPVFGLALVFKNGQRNIYIVCFYFLYHQLYITVVIVYKYAVLFGAFIDFIKSGLQFFQFFLLAQFGDEFAATYLKADVADMRKSCSFAAFVGRFGK